MYKASTLALVLIMLVSCDNKDQQKADLLNDSTTFISDTDINTDTTFIGRKPSTSDSVSMADYSKLDSFMNSHQLGEALKVADKLLERDSSNTYALAEKSIIYTRMANDGDKAKLDEAGKLARQSFKLAPKDATTNLAMALYYGALTNEANITEKGSYSTKIKQYAERCLQLSPMHPEANYIMGRWYYGLADLGKMKKMVAQKIIKDANAKEPTFELALSYFQKALKVRPDDFSYNYFTGACLYKMDKKSEGKTYMNKAMAISPRNKQERELASNAKEFK
ncbi:MAG: hypothetical protein SFW35_10070 [Chitinophagales bacterium]|nr:hypothetical protein [Chitinophagales bacterium]